MKSIFFSGRKLRIAALGSCMTVAMGFTLSPAWSNSVTIAISAGVQSFDPHFSTTVATDLSVISHLYSALVTRNPDGSITGDLAEGWEAVDDLTWKFRLRPGVTFPNGEPMDAEAVRWNFAKLLDKEKVSRASNWYKQISEIEVLSPTEFLLHTSAPFPSLINQLTMLFMLAPKWAGENDLGTKAMGTGPYEIVSYAPGERVVLKARENYHGMRPAYEDVTIRMLSEASVRVSALLAGELDLILDVPPTDVDRINASSNASAGWAEGTRMMLLRFNNLAAPFADNKTLRKAISHAIDRDLIAEVVFEGNVRVSTCQLATPLYFGYNDKLKEYAYDPELAKKLIAESGASQPLTIDMEVPTGRYMLGSEIGQIIAAQLGEVGVQVNLKEIEYASWSSAYTAGNMGQTAYMGQAWPSLDADGLLSLYSPENRGAYWKNEDFRSLLVEGRSTVDPEKRKEIYARASELMCEEAPVVFLFNQPVIYGSSKNVEWAVRGDDWVRAYDLKPKN